MQRAENTLTKGRKRFNQCSLLVRKGPKYDLDRKLLVPILVSCWLVNFAAGFIGVHYLRVGICRVHAPLYLAIAGLGNVILITFRLWPSDPARIVATLLPILFNIAMVSISYVLVFQRYMDLSLIHI